VINAALTNRPRATRCTPRNIGIFVPICCRAFHAPPCARHFSAISGKSAPLVGGWVDATLIGKTLT
jgi:hypothetical protein